MSPPTPAPDSLVSLAERSVRQFAARPVYGERLGGRWSWMTYRELGVRIDEVRGGLAFLGVGPGERVAIISRNSAAWAAAAYATYGLDATFVPMYEAQHPHEWQHILRDCEAAVVLVRTAEIASQVADMRTNLPALRDIVTLEGDTGGSLSLEELRRRGRESPVLVSYPHPDTIAAFIYTSGTTGSPKGVMLSHRNLASNVAASTAVFPVTATDRSVSFLPWAHVYGQTIELHILFSVGASTAFNHNVARLMDDLVEIQPTILVAVPRIFNRIYDGLRTQIASKPRPIQELFHRGIAARTLQRHGERLGLREQTILKLADALLFKRIRAKFGGRLRYAISASASLSLEVAELIDALGLDVYEGYGLSETSPVATANRPGERKLGSVGKPIPGVSIKLDESRSSEAGVGEIVVYGPNVMRGYHNRPEETAHAFTEDGGLRTGDLGRMDADGYLYITGRIKEQYKLENGKYVMPAPLEEELALSPYITTVMLYGDNRPYNVALVELDSSCVRRWAAARNIQLGPDLTREPAVHELIARELSRQSKGFRGYEKPRSFVLVEQELTPESDLLTPSLKIKRHAVVKRFGAALDALYETEDRAAASPPAASTDLGAAQDHSVRP